jgi:hypothetical protein
VRAPSWIVEGLASIGAIAAGLYLLASETVDPDSYLQTIAHGIGIYFIAKGFFMGASLYRQRLMLLNRDDTSSG